MKHYRITNEATGESVTRGYISEVRAYFEQHITDVLDPYMQGWYSGRLEQWGFYEGWNPERQDPVYIGGYKVEKVG